MLLLLFLPLSQSGLPQALLIQLDRTKTARTCIDCTIPILVSILLPVSKYNILFLESVQFSQREERERENEDIEWFEASFLFHSSIPNERDSPHNGKKRWEYLRMTRVESAQHRQPQQNVTLHFPFSNRRSSTLMVVDRPSSSSTSVIHE